MVTARTHLGPPGARKGGRTPSGAPGESAAPPPPRGQRPGLQPAREEVQFAVICQDATRTRACVSGGSWVCRSRLLLSSGPPGPGTGPPLHQELRLRPRRGRCALGCDHPQREGSSHPPLNHARQQAEFPERQTPRLSLEMGVLMLSSHFLFS